MTESVNDRSSLLSADNLGVQTFYQTRSDSDHDRLFGLTGELDVPGWNLQTELEASLAATSSERRGLVQDRNHLYRLRVRRELRHAAVSARLYSIGGDFAQSGAARERLANLGLPPNADGFEVSAEVPLASLRLRPSVRQVAHADDRVVSSRALAIDGRLSDSVRFSLLRDETANVLEAAEALSPQRSTTSRLSLATDDWNVYWSAVASSHPDGQVTHLAEVGFGARLLDQVFVSPRLIQHSGEGADPAAPLVDAMAVSAMASWSSLNLGVDVHHDLEGLDAYRLGATVSFSAPLRLLGTDGTLSISGNYSTSSDAAIFPVAGFAANLKLVQPL